MNTYYFFDFDSTFTNSEALEVLASISLEGRDDKDKILKEITSITSKAMEGKLNFSDALKQRVKLLGANKSHLEKLVQILKKSISVSVKRNKEFFKKNSDKIYVISGGFKEFIIPVVKSYGIKEENVYANEFRFNAKGNIIGFDEKNILSKDKGKINQLKKINVNGNVFVIGDGYTDFELKKAGLADKFFAYTENISRDSVTKNADYITPSLDEFLFLNKLPMAISYPKNRIKVLLLENIHTNAVKIFKNEGYQVEYIKKSLSENELAEKIKDVSILGIRSKTQITKKVLDNAKRLVSIGAYCIGTNQIDLDEALIKGVATFNAPFSNTRSVVELALAEIIILMRNIFPKSNSLHQGTWDKSASFSNEVRGKKLGIIGYGKIGSQLSILAEDLGMDVYFYDNSDKLALGNAKKCHSLKDLLKISDVITLHIDGSKHNTNFIDEKEFKQMKKGVIFLNLSRGHVVNLDALIKNIRDEKIRGCAIDVFPQEPESNDEKFYCELQNLPNVILTPHIAGSTEEAQENIAEFVPTKIIDFINNGNSVFSVNFPEIKLPSFENAHRLIHIHENVPGILAQINTIFSKRNINIIGQYLKTNEKIGYVITDISKKYNPELINDLKNIKHTIKFRVLY
ncbi:MAG: phosphoglycerate dehydrogenase [Ignavibacteria bacterium]|nr:phosphoglycerate dehydrogenase [Ignavibacteria bacterium]